ncbi:MAG: hypothetical protein JW986_04795 [Methanotrichaceae archaeon]|nr:hypothetical protein [Methanotrichaceae archaeon]
MPAKQVIIGVEPDMVEYISARSSDLRIATTCEGPILLPVRISQPKPTDHVVVVGERKVYVSAVQAPHIRSINSRMLPRCALQSREGCR